MSSARALAATLALSAVALLPRGQAQVPPREPPPSDAPVDPTDPRSAPDPRTIPDPRDASDPRETATTDPLLGPPGPELYDALYSTGQDARLKQALGENGWDLLAYIHTQCGAWLAQRDNGDPDSPGKRETLAKLEEKGRKLARMADTSLLDSRFLAYVETVFGWSEEQRQQHRETQELLREGTALMTSARAPNETVAALTPLHKALDRSRQLRDGRTETETLVAIGKVQAALRDEAAARATMQDAVRIGRELRDLDGVWSALSVLYESAVRTRQWDQAEEALQEQYLIAQDVADQATLQRVLRQLIDLEKFRDDRR